MKILFLIGEIIQLLLSVLLVIGLVIGSALWIQLACVMAYGICWIIFWFGDDMIRRKFSLKDNVVAKKQIRPIVSVVSQFAIGILYAALSIACFVLIFSVEDPSLTMNRFVTSVGIGIVDAGFCVFHMFRGFSSIQDFNTECLDRELKLLERFKNDIK